MWYAGMVREVRCVMCSTCCAFVLVRLGGAVAEHSTVQRIDRRRLNVRGGLHGWVMLLVCRCST